jgi:murein DD-endopeptidase MepM/ murein hydrolase activator NlpD
MGASLSFRMLRAALTMCVLVAGPGVPAVSTHAAVLGTLRGGPVPFPNDEISPAERARIKAMLAVKIAALQRMGRLPYASQKAPNATVPPPKFEWPLQTVPGHPEPVARTVLNYVDHNPDYPGQVLDYMCGSRTYDQADGYNHQGTDITSFPFAERKQNNDEVIVVAAAAGTILSKQDGQPDESCSLNSNPWNAVYLQHGDGSITWYGHLKKGSLTAKQEGDTVDVGEFLGVMGSSGDSSGPHLHFEVYDSTGNLIDPFAGPCNNFNAASWWVDQRPYNEPAIDLVMTGTAPVQFNACPVPDTENHSGYFQPGQTVYVTAFLTDQLQADSTVFTIYKPDGTVFATTTESTTTSYAVESYWEWSLPLPMSATKGTWRAEVAFAGQADSVDFLVGFTEPARADAVEYYDAALNHYFMTSFVSEITALDIGIPISGWKRTGQTFPTYTTGDPTLNTVCRYDSAPNIGFDAHFYSGYDFECLPLLQNPGWVFEADAFYIPAPTPDSIQCPPATRPVFRIYNNGQGGAPDHRYTTSWPIVSDMQSEGWILEGVAMCTPL